MENETTIEKLQRESLEQAESEKNEIEEVSDSKKAGAYFIQNFQFWQWRWDKKKAEIVPQLISRFILEINFDITFCDGYEEYSLLKGVVKGDSWLKVFSITGKDFYDNHKFQGVIGDKIASRYGFLPKDVTDIRMAAIATSKPEYRTVFAQFGWEDEKGEVFLTPSVKITKNGIFENIEKNVDLSFVDGASCLDLKRLEDYQLGNTVLHIAKDLLSLQDVSVTHPLLGHTFIAPLIAFCKDKSRYAMWLRGITGTGKSYIAKLFQCFWGDFSAEGSVTSWTSTPNFIQMVGFHFKDAVFLVDDFKLGNIREKQDVIQKLQTYADGSGRGRLNVDATTKKTKAIRGLLLSTGEDAPEHEASTLARMLILDCRNIEKNLEKGYKSSEYREHYPGVMAEYIYWFLETGKKKYLENLIKKHTKYFYEDIAGAQNDIRIARNCALCFTGFHLFCSFAVGRKILEMKDAERMAEICLLSLRNIRDAQLRIVKDEQGSVIFLRVLSDLIGSGRVTVHNPNMIGNDGQPIEPSDLKNMVGFEKEKDDDRIYIIPTVAYMEVQRILKQSGGNLNISREAIGKQLLNDGIILETDNSRSQKRVRYKTGRYWVWVLAKSSLDSTEKCISSDKENVPF